MQLMKVVKVLSQNNTQNESVFSDIRDYVPGDSLNRIHWKLTAKEGKWLTKDFQGR
jgi:uncharacterized protein (DUF58 family)